MSTQKQLQFRSLTPVEGHSPHFLAALQVLAHVLSPLRKALVHFYLMSKNQTFDKMEWQILQALGKILKELIAAPTENSNHDNDDDEEEDEDERNIPVDPSPLYKVLEPCLKQLKKNTEPKDATEALQVLFETIEQGCRTLPVTSRSWSALLDEAGLGLVAKQSIVGKCTLFDDGQILQRTAKESCIEWCPLVLSMKDTLEEALKEHCAKQPYSYDFDKEPFDFEVRIPLWSTPTESSTDDAADASSWTTTKTLQWTTLRSYLFLGIQRHDKDGNFNEDEVSIPQKLDVSKLCASSVKGGKEYELVGGILHDEDDYVALLKNQAISDPDDDDAWKLMESEEIIPMTERDGLEFLKGEGEGAPCGTVLVYRRCDDHKEMNQLLSDIVIPNGSGTLNARADFYYEEEVIED
jgi:hypothetical protein